MLPTAGSMSGAKVFLTVIALGAAGVHARAVAPNPAGYSGTVRGQVWRGDEMNRVPAPQARVQIRDPLEQKTWTTYTDDNGRYELRGAPLRANRPPFEITAEKDGALGAETYDGMLEKPTTAHPVLEKDVFLGPHKYTVTVKLDLDGLYVPDGRMTLSRFGFEMVFDKVSAQFEPEGNIFWGCCHLESLGGRGTITRLALNDVKGGTAERHRPWIIRGPPKQFTGMLAVPSDRLALARQAQGLGTIKTPTPPELVKVEFRTELWLTPVAWQSRTGLATLHEFKVFFEAPWSELLAGRPFTATLPYENSALGESGRWTISFVPRARLAPQASVVGSH